MGGPSALTMYSLLSAQPLTNWIVRGAIAPQMQCVAIHHAASMLPRSLLSSCGRLPEAALTEAALLPTHAPVGLSWRRWVSVSARRPSCSVHSILYATHRHRVDLPSARPGDDLTYPAINSVWLLTHWRRVVCRRAT
jgi:hypothetical protein